MFYRICPHCGCSLDPSESCDCQQERRSERKENKGRRQDGEIQKTDTGKSITVAPSGKDRRGVPNAIKAAVYQTGNSKYPARPWKTLADERGKEKVMQRMQEVFNEEMSKDGGGSEE